MKDLFAAISAYSVTYGALEKLQRQKGSLLPIGDQKTGVIAEFYARLYAATHFTEAELIYGHPSEHAWDIKVRRSGVVDHKIQVKAVSAHSSTSRVSKIHSGWHELYLLRLDETFWPVGFWVLLASAADWSAAALSGATMPRRNTPNSGSLVFRQSEDKLDQLLEILNHARG